MILVVGGIASGKRAFACRLGFDELAFSRDIGDGCPVLDEAQELVRGDGSLEGESLAALAQRIADSKQLVTFTEVGLGIVPMDAAERAWRERAGALSRELAARAETVVRMTCGIPQVIKGSLEAAPDDPEALPAHAFFSNRACKYFPCHEGIGEDEFNCLYCYCPLYALGPACGGKFSYTDSGRKNCKACSLPHRRDAGAKLVSEHFGQLAALAAQGREGGAPKGSLCKTPIV